MAWADIWDFAVSVRLIDAATAAGMLVAVGKARPSTPQGIKNAIEAMSNAGR